MFAERHIFGSLNGYRTLAASPGLTPDECRQLENFNFGQPPDEKFIQSLVKTPSFWVRTIGARRVLTRMLPGGRDDKGRATVILFSVVVSIADWDHVLHGDISVLLNNDRFWQWDGSSSLPVVPLPSHSLSHVSVPKRRAEILLSLISLVENANNRETVVVSEKDLSLEDIRLFGILLPPKARQSTTWAYRSLNHRLEANLNCVASEIINSSGSSIIRLPAKIPHSLYARVLLDAGIQSGKIVTSFIEQYTDFGFKDIAVKGPSSSRNLAEQPVIVVPPSSEKSLFITYGGWGVAAILAIILAWQFFMKTPEKKSEVEVVDNTQMVLDQYVLLADAVAKPNSPAKRLSAVLSSINSLDVKFPEDHVEELDLSRLTQIKQNLTTRQKEIQAFENELLEKGEISNKNEVIQFQAEYECAFMLADSMRTLHESLDSKKKEWQEHREKEDEQEEWIKERCREVKMTCDALSLYLDGRSLVSFDDITKPLKPHNQHSVVGPIIQGVIELSEKIKRKSDNSEIVGSAAKVTVDANYSKLECLLEMAKHAIEDSLPLNVTKQTVVSELKEAIDKSPLKYEPITDDFCSDEEQDNEDSK